MQIIPYRFRIKCLLFILLSGLILVMVSCKEEQAGTPPHIELINSDGYTVHDTILGIGDRIRVGVDAFANGDNITFFQVSLNNGTQQILLDSGLNHPDLVYNLDIIKSAAQFEIWTFLVMDRDRNKDSVQILLNKSESSHYGNIMIYEDVMLGAQDNSSRGSFLSFSDGKIFSLDSAFLHQELIDLIYYFGQYDATLSSPNETDAPSYFTGPSGIANWTVKNETRYDTTALAMEEFDKALNDSLLLAVYEPTAGKRKVKFVEPGMVISFKNKDGRIGLLKIIGIEPGSEGTLNCSVKIQE